MNKKTNKFYNKNNQVTNQLQHRLSPFTLRLLYIINSVKMSNNLSPTTHNTHFYPTNYRLGPFSVQLKFVF